jgi:hypothetical protein
MQDPYSYPQPEMQLSGPMQGTPISMLRADVPNNNVNKYVASPPPRQQQYDPNFIAPQQSSPPLVNKPPIAASPVVMGMMKELNNALAEKTKKKTKDTETETETETETDEEDIVENKEKKSEEFDLLTYVKEGVVFLLIYILLSCGTVKKILGKYLPFINPDPNGTISLFGITFYGLLLVVIFFVARNYIIPFW